MRVTNHVAIRMEERKITQEHLVACIQHGKIVPHKTDADKKVILGHEVIMVINKDASALITVFPTKGRKSL